MDVFTAIEGRRSIRRYSSRPVENEKLNKIFEAVRLAPSAKNLQSWKFIIVKDDALRAKLAGATHKYQFIGQAPIIIVACGTDPEGVMMCGQFRHSVDLSIATTYLVLEAYEQGLGTCWIGHFDEGEVKEVLGIPEGVRVVALSPLGYPDENPAPRPRKKLEEIVCHDRYEQK